MTTDAELADEAAKCMLHIPEGRFFHGNVLVPANLLEQIIAALRRQSGEIDKIVEIVVQLEYDHWLRNGSAIKKQDAVLVSADVRRLLTAAEAEKGDRS